MVRRVTAFSNPLVKLARGLRDKKNRRREGRFLAEGLRILTEAREAGFLPEILFFAPRSEQPLLDRLIAKTEAAGGQVIETPPDILHKISGKENPQTVLGVYKQFDTGLAGIDRTTADLWIVAQALRDPGNLGTILRTGDAVGAGGLILIDECADPFSVEAVRASMGAVFTQKIAACDWDSFLSWLRPGHGMLVGTSLKTTKNYRTQSYAKPVFLLIGNEAQGLPETYEAVCDLLVKIPMLGKADSLNAAIATAVMAYEIVGQWQNVGPKMHDLA